MAAEIHIHDLNFQQFLVDQVVDGERKARGQVPRDYTKFPRGFYKGAKAIDVPLIDRAEYPERIRDKIANKSQLSDVRMRGAFGAMIPSRDQNGKGYCWFHSGTSCMLLVRARDNQPYVDLSAYAGACVIKNFRDEGGWGAQGVDFQMERGIPASTFWPQRSMDRANDKPETWANAALHRFTEGFIDLQAAQYDRKLSFDQLASQLLSDNPAVVDFNWWSHSVCGADLVDGSGRRNQTRAESGKLVSLSEFETIWGINDPVTAGYGLRIWNSWGDSWSDNGMGLLSGSKAVPDGSVVPREVTPADV
jgi:hypothetical protein